MRIVVMQSEEYHQKCGRTDHHETREYTVNIIPNTVNRGNTLLLTTKIKVLELIRDF